MWAARSEAFGTWRAPAWRGSPRGRTLAMRQAHYLLACMIVTSAAALVAACAKAPVDGKVDEDDTAVEAKGGAQSPVTPDGTPASDPSQPDDGTCSLARSRLSFETQVSKGGACDTCMQNGCCAQTTACFIGNTECAALNACILACNGKAGDAGARDGGGGGNGMGNGMGGGGGADAGDAGPGCTQDCIAKHPTAVDAQKAFFECYDKSCTATCQ
jgi:hypothetical protein